MNKLYNYGGDDMKKLLVSLLIVILFIGIIFLIMILDKTPELLNDEDIVYTKAFDEEILQVKRYDYSLGQRMIIGVEKSNNNGKNFEKVTQEMVEVSLEAKFEFLNKNLGFIIDTGYLDRNRNFKGLLVTNDGGITFKQAEITYDNENVDLISIQKMPYYENDKLKLECSVYIVDHNEDLVYYSVDNGNTWINE